MLLGIILSAFLFLFYILFIKGWLWKIILCVFEWFGIFVFCEIYIPETREICFTLSSGSSFSWASVIPTIVVIMAMACSKED